MAKRFTDTDIWNKKWFRILSPTEKALYFYLKDKCDCVGVYDIDEEVAEFLIGGDIDLHNFIDKCNGNLECLGNGKLFIVDFCGFQYGTLTESCPPHKKYISVLKKHGLFERVLKGYSKGIETLQEEEKEKEVDKEKEKEEAKENKDMFDKFWKAYPKKVGKTECGDYWKKHIKNYEAILDALTEYKKSDRVKGGFIRDPIRFLKKDFWRDFMPQDFDLSVLPQQVQDNLENFGGE